MKLLCVVGISTRSGKGLHQTRKPAKATISIFQKNGESAMQIYTEKTKNGEKYKLRNNITQCRTKFLQEGKLTIELKEPSVNLMISKAEPAQLKPGFEILGSHNLN